MTVTRPPARAFSALVAVAAVAGACGTATEEPVGSMSAAATPETVTSEEETRTEVQPGARTDDEQAYLSDLSGLGLPTEMTAETSVEVGIGVCRGIADGADTETILDRIRPLTSAIAAQSAELDSAEVGRAIIDASRTHLCD